MNLTCTAVNFGLLWYPKTFETGSPDYHRLTKNCLVQLISLYKSSDKTQKDNGVPARFRLKEIGCVRVPSLARSSALQFLANPLRPETQTSLIRKKIDFITSEAMYFLTSFEFILSELKASVTALLSKRRHTSLKKAALRSNTSTILCWVTFSGLVAWS